MSRSLAAILIVVLGTSAACARGTRYVHPNSDIGVVKRVAVLPFENVSSDKLAGDRLQRIFITELLALGAFQVVEPGEVARAFRGNAYDVAALGAEDVKKLGQALKADALFVGSVVEYDEARGGGAVPNPLVTIQFRLVETGTSATLWAVSRTSKGATVTARLFGLGGKSASELSQQIVQEELRRLVQ